MRDVISRPIQALWGAKQNKPDIAVLQSMLELITEAAIIVDGQNNRLLHTNSPFSVLTAYSLNEIVNAPLDELFESYDKTTLLSSVENKLYLKLRKRPSMAVVTKASLVDPTSHWYVIKIIPQAEHSDAARAWNESVLNIVRNFPELIVETDLPKTMHEVVAVTRKMFDTNLVCIYTAAGGYPELTKQVSSEDIKIFPDTLPSTDLIRLSSTNLWIPGKRVVSELHKAARVNEMSYVATTPLGQDNAMVGLLVVGGVNSQPHPMLLQTIEVLGIYVSLVVNQSFKAQNINHIQAQLQKKLGQMVTYFENGDEGMVVLKPNLTVEDLNPAAELLLLYTRSEVVGESAENVLISPDRLLPILTSACQGVVTPNLDNITLHRRNGQSFPASVKVIPVIKDDSVISINVFIQDISEHESIRAQTRQLEQRALLGEFMGVFAHEVLNPINSISTGLQLLNRKLGPENPNLDIVNRMENDCLRLHHQMEALKNFAKPYEPLQELVDMKGLLNRIFERWRPRMSRLNITPVLQVPDDLPGVKGDWRALEQVFTNLISNAIDAMNGQTGGILSLRAEVSSFVANHPQVEISVSDNGPGIPDEIRDRIFEPFVTTKSLGTGLGLPITKRIVTAHRGSITLNTFPGGTVFHVYLPACEEEQRCP